LKSRGDGRTVVAVVEDASAVVVVGDLWVSQLHEQVLCSLALEASEGGPEDASASDGGSVDGADVGVDPPDVFSFVMGIMVFRKSVYAIGGVIGVLMPSSSFIFQSAHPGNGLRAELERAESSDGKADEMAEDGKLAENADAGKVPVFGV